MAARRFLFLGPAAMAPVRCLLPLLPALALALGPAAGEAGRPLGLEALGEAEELTEELWGAGLPGDLPELEPECRRLLAAFAEGSAALTGCLGRRARPVRLCQACHRHYRRLLAQYGNITRAVGVRPRAEAGAGNGGLLRGGPGRGPGVRPGPQRWRVGLFFLRVSVASGVYQRTAGPREWAGSVLGSTAASDGCFPLAGGSAGSVQPAAGRARGKWLHLQKKALLLCASGKT